MSNVITRTEAKSFPIAGNRFLIISGIARCIKGIKGFITSLTLLRLLLSLLPDGLSLLLELIRLLPQAGDLRTLLIEPGVVEERARREENAKCKMDNGKWEATKW